MADDWDTFSASPYQQEQASPGIPLITLATSPFLCFDWPDSLEVFTAMLLGGKKAIWIDLLAAQQMGLSGQDIQNRLSRQGIEIHAKAIYPLTEETIAAVIAVDAEDEAKARKALANLGVLLR